MADRVIAGAGSANPASIALGDLIRDERRSTGMTQGELAEGICTRPYISQIEKGTRFPAPAILKRLADKLKLPLGHFAPAYLASPMAGIDQCLGLAAIQSKDGSTEDARRSYEQALTIHQRRGSPASDIPAINETLGIILLHEGRYDECEPILEEALERRMDTAKPTVDLAEVCTSLGVARIRQGNLKPAADMFQKAFNIVFAIGAGGSPGRSARVTELQHEIVEWLMRVFVLQRQFHTAHTIYAWATSAWTSNGDKDLPPGLAVLKAIADLGIEKPGAAQASLQHLLNSGACAGNPRLTAAVHNNLAVTYRLMRNWDQARYHATMALDIWRRHASHAPGWHASTNEVAYAALATDDLDGAREALALSRQPLVGSYQVPDPILTAESFLLEARLALAEGDAEKARDCLDSSEKAFEDVRWIEALIHVERLQAAFEDEAPGEEKQAALDALRSTIEKWAI